MIKQLRRETQMNDLADKTCEVCRTGAPLATREETNQFMAQLPDWQIIEVDGINRLRRTFKFKDFAAALAHTNKVGALAEAERHHPAILT